jgi:hypothetical protein
VSRFRAITSPRAMPVADLVEFLVLQRAYIA